MKIDQILASIGIDVAREVPFKPGVLGEEALGIPVMKRLGDLAKDTGLLVH